jgi:hypothetical protein
MSRFLCGEGGWMSRMRNFNAHEHDTGDGPTVMMCGHKVEISFFAGPTTGVTLLTFHGHTRYDDIPVSVSVAMASGLAQELNQELTRHATMERLTDLIRKAVIGADKLAALGRRSLRK